MAVRPTTEPLEPYRRSSDRVCIESLRAASDEQLTKMLEEPGAQLYMDVPKGSALEKAIIARVELLILAPNADHPSIANLVRPQSELARKIDLDNRILVCLRAQNDPVCNFFARDGKTGIFL